METMIKATKIKNSVYFHRSPVKDAYSGYLYKQLQSEGCGDFYNYIDWLDLVKDLNIIILPSTNYYYYLQEDLEYTKTVINLKPLNRIKNLRVFLRNIFSILPDYSYLTGCYENNGILNSQAGSGKKSVAGRTNLRRSKGNDYENTNRGTWLSGVLNGIFNPGINLNVTRTTVKALLKEVGLPFLILPG